MYTRRHFLQHASLATGAAIASPRRLHALASSHHPASSASSHTDDPDRAALLARAIDAARSAGAAYADARITQTLSQEPGWYENEERGIGVRALVNGYWGFLASAVWTPDEAARLARGAVAQARANSRGKVRPVELGPAPVVRNGQWSMPVKYDPFDVPVGEKLDVMNAFSAHAERYQVGIGTSTNMSFQRQRRDFASSDGATWTQTCYQSEAKFGITYHDEYHAGLPSGSALADGLSSAGRGWELVSESGLMDAIPRIIDEAEQARHVAPFEVGRYDVVFSAEAMAAIVDRTFGAATELDRALGYEANASGTSYLRDPLERLGSVVASPLVTIGANRSVRGGLSTVAWDDEGVVPEDFLLVKDGLLVDYQTTREQAAWLAPYYQRVGRPVRSHGCAAAESALVITMQQSPNIALLPGSSTTSFDELVASTERGIAVLGLGIAMDQQSLNGMGYAIMREIRRGKLGRFFNGGAVMFRAPEFWKSIVAIGGPASLQWFGGQRGKGQPNQTTMHSIGAVPAKVTQVSIIDPMRKA